MDWIKGVLVNNELRWYHHADSPLIIEKATNEEYLIRVDYACTNKRIKERRFPTFEAAKLAYQFLLYRF